MRNECSARKSAFFLAKNTERALHNERSQRRKRTGSPQAEESESQLIDAVINDERVRLAKNPAPREKGIEVQIRVALAAAGVLVMKHNVDARGGVGRGLGLGVADLICVVPPLGRFLAIEVKRPGYTQSDVRDAQRRWLGVVLRFGGIAGIATSVDEAMALVARARQ